MPRPLIKWKNSRQSTSLLDIEIITLIALAIGVTLYAVIRRQSDNPIPSTPHWDVYDLGLMFFPAIMFLMGPFLLVSAAGTEQESAPGDATPGYGALLFNLGIYVFVLMMVHAIVEWIRLRSMKEVFWTDQGGSASNHHLHHCRRYIFRSCLRLAHWNVL